MPRVLAFVMDSAGVGALPDAATFGDAPKANTIGNVAERVGGLHMPNFERLGLGRTTTIRGVAAVDRPAGAVGRLREKSRGKDTITGHWEMAGIVTEVPFPTYPDGFPADVIDAFTAITGKPPLGNVPASGTEIIAEMGEEHQRTGRPILYTSADSVFQVACHEDTVPLATLYDWCEKARAMLVPPHEVNRVIARPFNGPPGGYSRTANRRDYAVSPPPSILDRIAADGVPIHAVGKICDIYCGHGIVDSIRVADNTEGVAQALLDGMIPAILERIRPGDGLIFTADHGCDPTAPGSDHTREYVPFLEYGTAAGADIGVVDGMSRVGERMAAILGVDRP